MGGTTGIGNDDLAVVKLALHEEGGTGYPQEGMAGPTGEWRRVDCPISRTAKLVQASRQGVK